MAGQTSKTVRRWFWEWDFEEEVRWLNSMALEGWALDGVGLGKYRFVACEPGEYAIGLDMHKCDDGYLAFMEETGAEYVGRVWQYAYFRKKGAPGSFSIYSDRASRVKRLRTLGSSLTAIAVANVLIAVCNSLSMSGLPWVSWINFACAMLLLYALGRTHGKIESLEADSVLME